jgi:hypothetical protein
MEDSFVAGRPVIPSEVKRIVMIEAGHRCAIQTCRNSANIDVHHIVPWEKCKDHNPDNLIVLCPNCHRLAHDETIDRKSLRKYKEICRKLTNPPSRHEDEDVKAYIEFNPNTVAGIMDAKNISSFIDHGILNISVNFDEPFEDITYIVNAMGDASVNFKVIEKSTDTVQIVFEQPCPDLVRLEFKY